MLDAPPDLDPLIDLFADRPITVLAGAGCSTDSGIPDYGGLHSRTRKSRIQFKEFVEQPEARQRYWARAAIGWRRVRDAQPNAAHRALARLEDSARVTGVITQNVDGLHHRAGSRRVVELHGSLDLVACLDCDAPMDRTTVQDRLQAMNPWIAGATAPHAPDGDAELTDERLSLFEVPSCEVCGGVLKPGVVFFGETVPKHVIQQAWRLYEEGEVLLVVGSSLAVFSGFRFVLRASQDGRPVAIVNRGPTRADDRVTLKIDGAVGAVLPELVARLGA